MIYGLHNHLKDLSGDSKKQFLNECLIQQANIISITDHRTLSSYYYLFNNLTKEELVKYSKLRFVIGMELTGSFSFTNIEGKTYNICVDILGYNLNPEKYARLQKFIFENYTEIIDTPEFQQEELEFLISVAKKIGFKADYDNLQVTNKDPLAARILAYALINPRYVDYNLKLGLHPEIVTNPRSFFNRYCKSNTPFYIDRSAYFPDVFNVIDKICACDGMAFLPHTAAYFPKIGNIEEQRLAWLDSRKFTLDFLMEHPNIQGLEIIHPSYLDNQKFYNFMAITAKERSLFVSGGTDYHKNGEKITLDYSGNYITDDKLYNVLEWAKLYTVYDLIDIGKVIEEIDTSSTSKIFQKR